MSNETEAATPPPPPPPPPPTTPPPGLRRLWRSREDRRIAGVCGGIAEYFGIDPVLVRLAVVALFVGGIGFFLYPLAWIIMPTRPKGAVTPRRAEPGFSGLDKVEGPDRTVLGALAAVTVVAVLAFGGGSWLPVAVFLVGAGIWLLSQQPAADESESAGWIPPPAGGVSGLDSTADSVGSQGGLDLDPGAPRPDPADMSDDELHAAAESFAPIDAALDPPLNPPIPPPPGPGVSPHRPSPSRRNRATTIVVGMAGTMLAGWAALVAVAGASGWWELRPQRVIGIGLIILGAAVVVAVVSGAGLRLLLVAGLLGLLALAPVAAFGDTIDDGFGDRVIMPLTLDELQTEYRLGAGSLQIDLTRLDPNEIDDIVLDVHLGAGDVSVIVPPRLAGTAVANVDFGQASFSSGTNRQRLDGVDVELGPLKFGGDDGGLDLRVNARFGDVEIEQAE